MKKIAEGPSRRVGTIFQEIDTNFIEVCNAILRIAYPELTILGYAETEPANPTAGDSYLVKEAGTIWELSVQKDHIIHWLDSSWYILPYKITEINDAFQAEFFTADKITIGQISGLTADNVQEALAEICAALVTEGIL